MNRVADPQSYPLAPWTTMPWLRRVRMARRYHVGAEMARDDVGYVALVKLGPRRLVPPFAVVTSPQGARDVLAGTDPAIDKTGLFFNESRVWWGVNVFNLAHEQWLPRRRTLQPLFTKKHVATFAANMADAAEELVAAWGTRTRVDLNEECRTLTLRVLSRSVLGTDLGDRAHDLGIHMERVVRFVTRRSSQPGRMPPGVPTPARRRFRNSLREVHSVIDEAVAACRSDPTHDAPLIRLMLEARDPDTGEPLSDKAIRDELFIFMFAGHDTTATTITYTLWVLGRHPEIQRRVAEEAAGLGARSLRVEDVPKLPFTMHVMNEALRLCPPAAAIARRSNSDIVVDGRRLPAGTEIIVGVYAMHRDPALWEDAETFDPERFSAERSKGRNRWQFLPFGGGPRACIGEHFAVLEATLGLATVIRALTITAERDDFPVTLPFSMTADGEIPATVSVRADSSVAPMR